MGIVEQKGILLYASIESNSILIFAFLGMLDVKIYEHWESGLEPESRFLIHHSSFSHAFPLPVRLLIYIYNFSFCLIYHCEW